MGPRSYSTHQLGAKVEMVYSLLSMLGSQDRSEMTRTLLSLSNSPESCLAMRQSGEYSHIMASLRWSVEPLYILTSLLTPYQLPISPIS